MKRIILITAILLTGCSVNDQDSCTCDYKVAISDGNDVGYYYITNAPIDCETEQLLDTSIVNDNHFLMGCVN